jgi:protein disulfide-isomerase
MTTPSLRLLSFVAALAGLPLLIQPAPAQGTRPPATAAPQNPPTAPEAWKWTDLINRPERWAPEVTLRREMRFDDGTGFPAGAIVHVTKVSSRSAEVILPDGSTAEVEPEDTDVLTASNRYWTSLTPAQRAVDFAAIVKDRTLQPTMVTSRIGLTFASGDVAPGAELPLADIVGQRLHVWSIADAQAAAISPTVTDLLVRARALAALTPEQRAKTGWMTDYSAALARAKEEQKKVFLFFTGSDWCGWCMRLEREILKLPAFTAYAKENLVLVKLDFPRGFRLPAAEAAQNQQLSKQYGVRGYPTVVVLDPAGRQVGQLGYQAGGPGPFIQQLNAM